MDHPPADPAKLLDAWMEWEKGEALPGRTMSTFKTGGLRDILERLASEQAPVLDVDAAGAAESESWTPVV